MRASASTTTTSSASSTPSESSPSSRTSSSGAGRLVNDGDYGVEPRPGFTSHEDETEAAWLGINLKDLGFRIATA
eukprot:242062-Heterocapsa_arctica.AAC.1